MTHKKGRHHGKLRMLINLQSKIIKRPKISSKPTFATKAWLVTPKHTN